MWRNRAFFHRNKTNAILCRDFCELEVEVHDLVF
jgi:hypothetical protein